MNNEVSITALMSSFGRAFHAENEDHPVFTDHLAKELMTAEEYAAVLTAQSNMLCSAQVWIPSLFGKKNSYQNIGYLKSIIP